MSEFHRKIELQSTEDLQYLVQNVRRAAHQKIDRDLPPIEGEDKMRRHVEELVDEVRLLAHISITSLLDYLSSSLLFLSYLPTLNFKFKTTNILPNH